MAEVLIPLIVKYLSEYPGRPLEIEDDDDWNFMVDLKARTGARERTRGDTRVFSPSSLGHSCIRYPYLTKHVEGRAKYSPATIYTFATGTSIHEKIMLLLYKMEKWYADDTILKIHGFEITLLSKHGDFGGTMDVVASIFTVPYVIDIKGLNTHSAKRVSQGSIPATYKTQVGSYLLLWNSQRGESLKITKGMLLVEDKSGGSSGKNPLPMLSEAVIDGKSAMARARKKIERLRDFEKRDEMPAPACRSLKSRQFQGCPMKLICWDEVEAAGKAWSKKTKSAGKISTPNRVSTVLSRKRISKP